MRRPSALIIERILVTDVAIGPKSRSYVPGTMARFSQAIAVTLVLSSTGGCASTGQGEPIMTNAPSSAFDPRSEVQPATLLLRSYESALNAADVAAIVSLYAPDAVFMAQHRNPAVGAQQIEAAYREIFEMIRLDIRFEIDEVVVVSPTVAYARTRSLGTTTIVANEARVSEGNQELFVLVRPGAGSEWKIGRYIFSTTRPRG